jgi:hypothetical protein
MSQDEVSQKPTVQTTEGLAIKIELAEEAKRTNQEGATVALQKLVQSVNPDEVVAVYKQVAAYDEAHNKKCLIELGLPAMTTTPSGDMEFGPKYDASS